MPLIVDPSVPQVTPPAIITSPDGWLSAVVDEPWAGVLLGYNADTPPAARNIVLNPSAEIDLSNTSNYGSVTRARVTSSPRYGTACIQHTQGGSLGNSGTIYTLADTLGAGTVICASAWVKVTAGTTCFFTFRNAGGAVGTVTGGTPATGTWVRVTATYTVPSGQTVDRVSIAYNCPTSTVWYSDGMMVETGVTAPSAYCDGSQPGCTWEGAAHASASIRVTAAPDVADIRKVRITRQDPGAPAPVPVRSADPAWAIEGVGPAYDHEPPLGVTVIYTATPLYADGSAGPSSSLAVTMPEPGRPADVWIKSLDDPGLSARVTVISWPQLQWASRIDQGDIAGSPYPATSQDVYAAAASEITIDADGDEIEKLRKLLVTPGVRLIQTRPAAHRPDQFVLFANPGEAIDADPDGSRTFTAAVQEVGRPSTAAQPLRIPGWSYDALAAAYGTYDAVSATFPSYQQLATNGRLE
ncbi:carbohydrate binding domain-containing protein [Streptomyces parvulus]|uniref:carbohydrate binding domain-containing protein n=1 Tax=Streptomyces parvulus TaxID=146923 RepID=UPI0033A58412